MNKSIQCMGYEVLHDEAPMVCGASTCHDRVCSLEKCLDIYSSTTSSTTSSFFRICFPDLI